jgi:hypothetical protein
MSQKTLHPVSQYFTVFSATAMVAVVLGLMNTLHIKYLLFITRQFVILGVFGLIKTLYIKICIIRQFVISDHFS